MSTSESDKNAEREIDAMTDGQVAPTPTGTSNAAAVARAKEANLAAKKSPPAAQKPLKKDQKAEKFQKRAGEGLTRFLRRLRKLRRRVSEFCVGKEITKHADHILQSLWARKTEI